MMDRADTLLIASLRCVLFGTPIPEAEAPCTMEDWLSLYNLAARQGVHTIIFDAFPKEQIPPVLLVQWQAAAQKVEQGNALMAAVVAAQTDSWKRHGITAHLMKGQSLACLYPFPQHRLCGDVDWYFPTAEDWNKAYESATRAAGCEPEKDSDGDVHYTWQGVVIEHHRCFHHLSVPRNKRYMKRLEESGEDWRIMNLIMLNTHILKHAMVLGVSLRQVCDLAMAYRSVAGGIDGERYRMHLKKLGLMRWTRMLHSLMVEDLGMPTEWLPFQLDRSCNTKPLLEIVLRSRNLGGAVDEAGGARMRRLLRTYMKASLLFLRICPLEFIFRGESLVFGRLSK